MSEFHLIDITELEDNLFTHKLETLQLTLRVHKNQRNRKHVRLYTVILNSSVVKSLYFVRTFNIIVC